jgi:simple sugar transport system permease protein
MDATPPPRTSFRRYLSTPVWIGAARAGAVALSAFAVFTVIMLLYGTNPWAAFEDMFSRTLGTSFGISEVLVKMSPMLLTAIAVAVPARVGLVNVGGEGQLFIGGLGATWVALTFDSLPGWILLPLMALAAFAAGGIWSGVAGWMRVRGWLSEVFSTLLLNYIGILTVSYLVFGPWRDPESGNYPQTHPIPDDAHLPLFGDSRVHIGIVVGLTAIVAFHLFLSRTRWGLQIKAIGGNPMAALHTGLPVARYTIIAMVVGGGLAGLAGMTQVAGIQFRLNPGLGVYIGYTGFLISWLAGHRPLAIIPMAFVLAVLAGGGDILQIIHGVPYAIVNVLVAASLCLILALRARRAGP